ncbi:hypothetical protein GCM10009548_02390 [Streptomyces malaysiensis subsp. malaysiensis]|uniref:SPOR domain-containing protein n=1 Tax=Streptomyces malaysiensis TaxID=92644 RepID=A0ABX6W4H2_STRMQ|nr:MULTISPECIES: hypothetical protein [Streptomyces]QPI56304.1 hypothetical protein I1A49_16370 [Streptomyces solisilvae]UHH17788.1 hypothetical protein LUV23_16490 [Streptomyces sp. HNM0561]
MNYQEKYELRCTFIGGDTYVREYEDPEEAQRAFEKEERTIACGQSVQLVRVSEVTLASSVRAR